MRVRLHQSCVRLRPYPHPNPSPGGRGAFSNDTKTTMTDSPFPLEPTAAEAQAAIAEEFSFFGDWSERYQYLIDLGRKLPPMDDALKTDAHRLHGCQSMVWIVPEGDADGQPVRFTLAVTQMDGRRAAWFALGRAALPEAVPDV